MRMLGPLARRRRTPGRPPAAGRGRDAGARRVAAALVPAILALCFLPTPAPCAERQVQVRGRISSAEGNGVPGQTVKLFKTRRGVSVGRFSSGGEVAEVARVTTDDNGFYEIDVPRDRSYDSYFLRFYDPETFDAVRFVAPEDREITRDLKPGVPLRVDVTLKTAPGWEAVARRLAEVGKDSAKGKILRSMGLPEKEEQGVGPDGPRDEWWYFTRGVVYFFREGEAAGFRRFDPVTPRNESAKK